MSRWNAELGALRAAVEGGARIVFTSRNYIWEAARPHLKMSAFPLLKESQVVVNVQALTENERVQMLYNHVRRAQPQKVRKRLKPFLGDRTYCRCFVFNFGYFIQLGFNKKSGLVRNRKLGTYRHPQVYQKLAVVNLREHFPWQEQ